MDQSDYLKQLREINEQRTEVGLDNWLQYSNMGTWQFWTLVVALLVPLIVFLIYLDRKKIFQILFFGFTIHASMDYIDAFSVANGYVDHPYTLIPALPVNLALNTSLIPVFFMLTYQYCINRGKNVYLYGLIASAITGLGLGYAATSLNFLNLYKGTNIWVVFGTDYAQFLIAYWLTTLFIKLGKTDKYVDAIHGKLS